MTDNQQPTTMTKDTITIKSIRDRALEYEDQGLHRASIRLFALAAKCDAGEVSPEKAIAIIRGIERECGISEETRRRIALQLGPKPERHNHRREPIIPLWVCLAIVAGIAAATAIASIFLP